MQTVNVDVQRLQLLNDRIAQTIEALNLVRMSVHGIQQSQVFGYNPVPFGLSPSFANPYAGYSPYAQLGLPIVPGIQQAQPFPVPFGQTAPWVGNGISHTSWEPSWRWSKAATIW